VSDHGQLLGFCVTASVAQETAHGEGGLDVRRGVRHFAAGAKVWVLPVQWGDGGEAVIVVGYHRGSRGKRYARLVMPRRHLTGFRVQGIYSPALLRALTEPKKRHRQSPLLWQTREEAEQTAAYWREHSLPARFDDHSFGINVSDPPPLELQRNGRTYYLAHFNARRAVYSPQPPPSEPSSTGQP
jgi:hypothetical protein